MLKQVFLARSEPVLTEFRPFHHIYAPLCALRTYLRAVWWSHLELGEGCRLEDIYIYIYIYIYTCIYIYIYYYTPLPLNLANKQQATTTTTRQNSVLATAPSHCLEPDLTLAIWKPSWWACQIQVLSQKLTGGGPGQGRQVGRCLPISAQFWAKNSHFSPKTALVRAQNSQTKANSCNTHVRRAFLVTKVLLVPSNSTIFPRNGPKRRQKAPKSAQCAPAPRNQERAVSWAT